MTSLKMLFRDANVICGGTTWQYAIGTIIVNDRRRAKRGHLTALIPEPSKVRKSSFDKVVGNSVPVQGGEFKQNTADESYRVLAPGGTVSLHSVTGGCQVWLQYLVNAGFQDVHLQGGRAVGVRP